MADDSRGDVVGITEVSRFGDPYRRFKRRSKILS